MDDIQRRLKLIDEQLGGGRDFHKKIVTTTPLLFLAIGLIAGIILQQNLHLGVWFWFVLLGFCAIATIAYLVSHISYFEKKSKPNLCGSLSGADLFYVCRRCSSGRLL